MKQLSHLRPNPSQTSFSSMNRTIMAMALLISLIAMNAAVFAEDGSDAPATPDDRPTLWIIGDSTVHNHGHGATGWGDVIAEYFNTDRIHIQNKAIGGRSSRTFLTEGRWDDVLEHAKPGDFVLMQFGHNDPIAPDDPKRPRGTIRGVGEETVDIINPHTGKPETVHTYGWYMRQYVQGAKEKGMIPIVCSYIPRAPRKGQTPDPTLTSYALYAKQVADQEHAAFIDLYGRINRDYIPIEADAPHAVKERYFVEGDRDYTHTNHDGAEFNAQHVVAGIRDLQDDAKALADFLKPSPEEEHQSGVNR